MTRDEVAEIMAEHNPEALLADGFEAAFIGPARRCGQPTLAAYSVRRALEHLEAEGLGFAEADEHLEFNVIGAWVGPHSPIWIDDTGLEE